MNKLTANDVHDLMNDIILLSDDIKSYDKRLSKINSIKFAKFNENNPCGNYRDSEVENEIENISSETGYTDWRVPTIDELKAMCVNQNYILNLAKMTNVIDGDEISAAFQRGYYWSNEVYYYSNRDGKMEWKIKALNLRNGFGATLFNGDFGYLVVVR